MERSLSLRHSHDNPRLTFRYAQSSSAPFKGGFDQILKQPSSNNAPFEGGSVVAKRRSGGCRAASQKKGGIRPLFLQRPLLEEHVDLRLEQVVGFAGPCYRCTSKVCCCCAAVVVQLVHVFKRHTRIEKRC